MRGLGSSSFVVMRGLGSSSFIMTHREGSGMFVTLVIQLPTEHTGGELVVQHIARRKSLT